MTGGAARCPKRQNDDFSAQRAELNGLTVHIESCEIFCARFSMLSECGERKYGDDTKTKKQSCEFHIYFYWSF